MVLLNELEMATPGENDSPPATNEEGASPTSAPQSPAMIGSPDAGEDAAMTPDPDESKAEEPSMDMPTDEVMPAMEDAAADVMSAMDQVKETVEETAGEMVESAMDQLRVEEVIEKAEDMVGNAQNEMQQTTQSLGNKVAKFIDGNLRKVKSLLHLNEKAANGEEIVETAKNLSNSTGNLDMDPAVRKSRACNIL